MTAFTQPSDNTPIINSAISNKSLKVINARVNKLGGATFDGLFKGMQKREDFIIHPLEVRDKSKCVTIQSDKHIGWITDKGAVYLSPSMSRGAHLPHLSLSVMVDAINEEEMHPLLECVSNAFIIKIKHRKQIVCI